MELRIGTAITMRETVKDEYLATHWKNDFPVLSTPVLLWLAELACMQVIDLLCGKEADSVGAGHNMKHLAATPAGVEFTITATLKEVDRKRLVFDVTAHDGIDVILEGQHERFLIDPQKFRARVEEKAAQYKQQGLTV